jgi:hypothetical protein
MRISMQSRPTVQNRLESACCWPVELSGVGCSRGALGQGFLSVPNIDRGSANLYGNRTGFGYYHS